MLLRSHLVRRKRAPRAALQSLVRRERAFSMRNEPLSGQPALNVERPSSWAYTTKKLQIIRSSIARLLLRMSKTAHRCGSPVPKPKQNEKKKIYIYVYILCTSPLFHFKQFLFIFFDRLSHACRVTCIG